MHLLTTTFYIWIVFAIVSCNASKPKKTDLEYLKILRDKHKAYPHAFQATFNAQKKVYRLAIDHIPLTQLPEEVYQFNQLEMLRLNTTALSKLPNLKPFKKLHTLMLINCNFTGQFVLPSYLKQLKELRLNSNKVKIKDILFPEDSQLKNLYLRNNAIQDINKSFLSLKKLEFLSLANNQLTEIDVSKLRKLNSLSLEGNPIKDTACVKKRHAYIQYLSLF